MSHDLSQSKWVGRFLDRLATLQPDLDSAEVLALTTAAYKYAGDLDPELAAEIYTRNPPPVLATREGAQNSPGVSGGSD